MSTAETEPSAFQEAKYVESKGDVMNEIVRSVSHAMIAQGS